MCGMGYEQVNPLTEGPVVERTFLSSFDYQ